FAQCPARPSAKYTQQMRRTAAENFWNIKPAANAKIGACAGLRRTKFQRLTRLNFESSVCRQSLIVQSRTEIRTGHCDPSLRRKLERSAEQRHLQGRCVFRIAEQLIADSQGKRIGRAGRRNSHRAEALAAQILH